MNIHLKDHADVDTVGAADHEVVQELHSLVTEGVPGVGGPHRLEELDLVNGGLCVVPGALHHLEGDEDGGEGVPAEPHRAEVPPAELPDHVISVVEEVPDLDRVVPSLAVVTGSLLLVVIRSEDLLLLLLLVLIVNIS